jgi:hypothetical protein
MFFWISDFVLNEWNTKRDLSGIGLSKIAEILHHQIAIPILGRGYSDLVIYSTALILVALLVTTFATVKINLNLSDSRITLCLSWIILAIATNLGSLNNDSGGRYAVLSGFVALLVILDCIQFERHPFTSTILASLLVVSLTTSLLNYRNDSAFACDGYSWQKGINNWQQNPSVEIPICPQSWHVSLRPI